MVNLREIAESVVIGNASKVEKLTRQAIDEEQDLEKIIYHGLSKGMDIVGEKWRKKEFYIPEVLIASRAMKAGMGIITPLLKKEIKKVGVFVIGTVKGDIHDIGKNLVCLMLEGAGFQVIDLGVNVDKEKFVQSVKDNNAQLVGLSALLTTTMPYMKDIIETLKNAGLRDNIKVMVGGAPVSQDYADEVGADSYAQDASLAVEKAKELIGSS